MVNILDLAVFGDDRGSLISLEENINVPFKIKRVYFIFDTNDGVSRGLHAHKDLEQVVICVKGSCRLVLDDGKSKESIILDSPNKGIYIDNSKWREMHDFSEDCILLVLASKVYDESDYIRHYKDFLKLVEK